MGWSYEHHQDRAAVANRIRREKPENDHHAVHGSREQDVRRIARGPAHAVRSAYFGDVEARDDYLEFSPFCWRLGRMDLHG